MIKSTLTLLAVIAFSASSNAYVETMTHGYQDCRACHVSPSGGGLLTDYGRSLSNELMSRWGSEKSAEPLFGAIANTDNLKYGGDARAVQFYQHSNSDHVNEIFRMQQNVELGWHASKNVWLVGTVGTKEGPTHSPDQGTFLSERHYVLIQPTDHLTVRVGKFRLNYGLNEPNHSRKIKDALGFPELSETYNLEVAQFNESNELFITASMGRLDMARNAEAERSLSVSADQFIGTKSKVGFSTLMGESADLRRFLIGLWGAGAVTAHSVLLGELDHQTSHAAADPTKAVNALTGLIRWGYTGSKGLMPYFIYEHLQEDMSDANTVMWAPGVGVQFMPYPHFEIQAEYQRQMFSSAPNEFTNWALLMLHFYI
jgi:hypothetical protein